MGKNIGTNTFLSCNYIESKVSVHGHMYLTKGKFCFLWVSSPFFPYFF